MTPEQQAAYVFAQSAAAIAEIEAMKAANEARAASGDSPAYGEDAFRDLIDKYGLHHNAVIGLFVD